MRVTILATIALAACSAASPLGNIPQARGVAGKPCGCDSDNDGSNPEVPSSTPGVPSLPPSETPAPTPIPVPSGVPTIPGIPSGVPTPTGLPPVPGNPDDPEGPEDPEDPEDPHKGGCDDRGCHGTGHLIQDLGPQANDVLTIVGLHTEKLLLKLSPAVAHLLAGLGLAGVGEPVGEIIKSAATIGELIADLGDPVECLLTVVGQDGGYLLIALKPSLTGLIAGLGLPSIAQPVGNIVGTIGEHLKRDDGLLEDLAPTVNCVLKVVGEDSKILLVALSQPVADLVTGLGLGQLAEPVGEVIKAAATVGDLVYDLGDPVECILTIVGEDGGILLVRLAPSVANLISGLGLPGVGIPVGQVVETLGEAL